MRRTIDIDGDLVRMTDGEGVTLFAGRLSGYSFLSEPVDQAQLTMTAISEELHEARVALTEQIEGHAFFEGQADARRDLVTPVHKPDMVQAHIDGLETSPDWGRPSVMGSWRGPRTDQL